MPTTRPTPPVAPTPSAAARRHSSQLLAKDQSPQWVTGRGLRRSDSPGRQRLPQYDSAAQLDRPPEETVPESDGGLGHRTS